MRTRTDFKLLRPEALDRRGGYNKSVSPPTGPHVLTSLSSRLAVAAALTAAVPTATRAPAVAARPSFSEPSVSPDNREIAFVSGGDIWSVPRAGGEARLLVSHAAYDSRPLYSPDGLRLAFLSTRTGNGDIYVLTL